MSNEPLRRQPFSCPPVVTSVVKQTLESIDNVPRLVVTALNTVGLSVTKARHSAAHWLLSDVVNSLIVRLRGCCRPVSGVLLETISISAGRLTSLCSMSPVWCGVCVSVCLCEEQ